MTSSDEPDGSFLSDTPSLNTFPGFSNPTTFTAASFELSTTLCRKYCTALKHYCWNMTCDTPSFPCSTANALSLPSTLVGETSLPSKFSLVDSLGSQFRATTLATSCLALRLDLLRCCVYRQKPPQLQLFAFRDGEAESFPISSPVWVRRYMSSPQTCLTYISRSSGTSREPTAR